MAQVYKMVSHGTEVVDPRQGLLDRPRRPACIPVPAWERDFDLAEATMRELRKHKLIAEPPVIPAPSDRATSCSCDHLKTPT